MHLVQRLLAAVGGKKIKGDGDEEWSEDGVGSQPSCACVSLQGRRPYMEDVLVTSLRHGQGSFFGCFDGHGGKRAALWARDHLESALRTQLASKPAAEALTSAFLRTNETFLEHAHSEDGLDDGCTALVALLVDRNLYVANAGDSRAVLCGKRSRLAQLSTDHTAEEAAERQRIVSAGGVIINSRIEGVLAPSRGFGDRQLSKWVSACPDVQHLLLMPGDDFLVLATDGVWSVLTNDQACSVVVKEKSALDAARKLTSEAIRRGSTDNVSAVVVDLRLVTRKIGWMEASVGREPSCCGRSSDIRSSARGHQSALIDEDAEDSDVEALLRATSSAYCTYTKY